MVASYPGRGASPGPAFDGVPVFGGWSFPAAGCDGVASTT